MVKFRGQHLAEESVDNIQNNPNHEIHPSQDAEVGREIMYDTSPQCEPDEYVEDDDDQPQVAKLPAYQISSTVDAAANVSTEMVPMAHYVASGAHEAMDTRLTINVSACMTDGNSVTPGDDELNKLIHNESSHQLRNESAEVMKSITDLEDEIRALKKMCAVKADEYNEARAELQDKGSEYVWCMVIRAKSTHIL